MFEYKHNSAVSYVTIPCGLSTVNTKFLACEIKKEDRKTVLPTLRYLRKNKHGLFLRIFQLGLIQFFFWHIFRHVNFNIFGDELIDRTDGIIRNYKMPCL